MFSQASVILSPGDGVCMTRGGMHGRGCALQGCLCGRVAYVAEGCAWWGGGHVYQGVCMAGQTATAVDSTHPTGMHFCYI